MNWKRLYLLVLVAAGLLLWLAALVVAVTARM